MSNRISALLATAALLLGGCGSGSGGDDDSAEPKARSSRPPRPAACRVGESALPAIPDPPEWWLDKPGGPVALACPGKGASGGAAIVGFGLADQACVTAYDFRAREAFDELCEEPKSSWTIQCEGNLGCTHAFLHEAGLTRIDGPLDERVKRIRVLVAGKPLEQGVVVAQVEEKLGRAIQAAERFAFFAIVIPECVEPRQVRIELFGAGGDRIGTAEGWDAAVDKCRHE
jgi:hypothetical protein